MLDRIDAIEARILAGAADSGDALVKLDCYAASARRAWHKSLDTLFKLHAAEKLATERESRTERNLTEAEINRVIAAPVPFCTPPPAAPPKCEAKPMPPHLERELAAHRRRDPLFDPRHDASQLSKELRKWFDKAA